ncbi:hypothetical protein NQZ68_017511 [Dissostichus eleginoides]|nr:hypothetical protein NQZ68_017511 [Dissostichus eleginoides]
MVNNSTVREGMLEHNINWQTWDPPKHEIESSTLTSRGSRGSPAALDVIESPAYDIILLLEINKFTLR